MSIDKKNGSDSISKRDLSGIQKSALLLVALDAEAASQIFKHF